MSPCFSYKIGPGLPLFSKTGLARRDLGSSFGNNQLAWKGLTVDASFLVLGDDPMRLIWVYVHPLCWHQMSQTSNWSLGILWLSFGTSCL